MHSQIAKSNRAFQSMGKRGINHILFGEYIKNRPHRCGHRAVISRNSMQGKIDTQLHGTAQIQRQNVLRIDIPHRQFDSGRAPRLYALYASPERFDFGGDYGRRV